MSQDIDEPKSFHQFWVSVLYDGSYRETKRHKPVVDRFTAHVPVQIQEIEAPVALEVDEVPGSACPIAFRWDGENFWRPLLDEIDAKTIGVDEFQEKATRRNTRKSVSFEWLDWPFPHRTNTRGYNVFHEIPFDAPMADGWRHDVVPLDLDEQTLAAQKAAEELRIIDEVVHMRTPEPCLALSFLKGIGIHPVLPGRKGAEGWAWIDPPLFRADRFDLVAEVAAAWNENDLAPQMETGLPSSGCRVLIPEAFGQDDLELAADHLFGPMLLQTQGGLSRMSSVATIETWIELRKLADRHAAGDTTAFLQGMNTLRQFVDGDLGTVPDASGHGNPVESLIKLDGIRRRIVANDAMIEEILGIAPPIDELDAFQL